MERRDEIRDQVRENAPIRDFWTDHPGWSNWRISRAYRGATWGAVTGWVGYGWSDPYPYVYGENVYYQDSSVYYGDQIVSSAQDYAQQAQEIVQQAPEVIQQQVPETVQQAPETVAADWLPLGVFALAPDGQASGPSPTLYLQLAISKEGVIAGTFYNSATNTTQTIEGMADKATQRVAWGVQDQKWPIMETGIANLTEPSSPALIHFADGQTQQWLMVRLEEPTSGS